MNRIRLAAFALVAGTVLLAAAALGLSRTAVAAATDAMPAATAEAKIARGKYLVAIMSCNDCHTPGTFYGASDAARYLAGSEMGWAGPWGIAYAANLTPDSLTGLGKMVDRADLQGDPDRQSPRRSAAVGRDAVAQLLQPHR